MSKFTEALGKIQEQRGGQPVKKGLPHESIIIRDPIAGRGASPKRGTDRAHEPLGRAEERRLHVRNRCLIPGRAVISSGKENSWIGQITMLNYSESGLLFEAYKYFSFEEPDEGDPLITLKLTIDPSSQEEFEVKGTIVRSEYKGKRRLGIRFEKSLPELSRQIENVA